jgi:hypothetical protein
MRSPPVLAVDHGGFKTPFVERRRAESRDRPGFRQVRSTAERMTMGAWREGVPRKAVKRGARTVYGPLRRRFAGIAAAVMEDCAR